MSITRFAVPLLAAVALVPSPLSPRSPPRRVSPGSSAPPSRKAGTPTTSAAECAPCVPVPLDYADPGGPKIDIAVSRIRATGERTGAVAAQSRRPRSVRARPCRGTIADSRGRWHRRPSRPHRLRPARRRLQRRPAVRRRRTGARPRRARQRTRPAKPRSARPPRTASASTAHPAFVRNLTTPTIARDLDRIRAGAGRGQDRLLRRLLGHRTRRAVPDALRRRTSTRCCSTPSCRRT